MTKFVAILDIEFTAGTLAGLSSRARAPFADHASAVAHANDMRGARVDQPCGGSPYVVITAFVEGPVDA